MSCPEAPLWRAISAVVSLLHFPPEAFRRQEGPYPLRTDGGADHAECIARPATVPRATNFRVGLQIVVELGAAAPVKMRAAAQIGQWGRAFQPVGGDALAVRRIEPQLVRELDPALDAREQGPDAGFTVLAQALIAAMDPDAPRGEPPPGIDAGAPDHLPGTRAVAIRPCLGARDEQADARIGKLVVAHLQ